MDAYGIWNESLLRLISSDIGDGGWTCVSIWATATSSGTVGRVWCLGVIGVGDDDADADDGGGVAGISSVPSLDVIIESVSGAMISAAVAFVAGRAAAEPDATDATVLVSGSAGTISSSAMSSDADVVAIITIYL